MDDYLRPGGDHYCRIARNSCTFLNSLIEDILDYSRFESGVFELNCEYFVLGTVLHEMRDLFSQQTDAKGIWFRFAVSERLLRKRLYTDKKRLSQVLLNLISNAIKFTS